MQISPMRRQLEPASLGVDQHMLVGLHRSQPAGRIQPGRIPPDHIIIEHTFNISPGTDIRRPFRAF